MSSNVQANTILTGQIAGLTVNVEGEYTRRAITDPYTTEVTTFANVLSLANQSPTPAELAAAGKLLESSVTSLIELARDGVLQKIDRNDPNSPSTNYYMTQDMVSRLDQLFESLTVAGATITPNGSNPPTVVISGDTVRRWLDLSLVTPIVGQLVQLAQGATEGANNTLQALVELEYVRTANELLAQKMSDLEEALQVAQDSLTTLKDVQDIHNQVKLVVPTEFVPPTAGDVGGDTGKSGRDAWTKIYTERADEALAPIGLEIDEQKDPTLPPRDLTAELIAASEALASQLIILSQVAPSSDIYNKVKVVHDEIVTALNGDPKNLANWFADGYSTINSSGQVTGGSGAQEGSGEIQANINAAISSTEAFNNSQTQEVSQFMFVFEEYYKSASAILTKISQLIEKMAQSIAR
jgi:hypothetical protein